MLFKENKHLNFFKSNLIKPKDWILSPLYNDEYNKNRFDLLMIGLNYTLNKDLTKTW